MGRMGNFDALNFSPLTNANAECVTKIEIENVLIFNLIFLEKFCINRHRRLIRRTGA